MTAQKKLANQRLTLLQLAEALGNVSEACRFTHHLRTRILHDGRIDGVGMGQGLRFLNEYLGYVGEVL